MIVSFIKPCKGNKSIILKVKQNRSGEGAVWSGPAWEGGRVGLDILNLKIGQFFMAEPQKRLKIPFLPYILKKKKELTEKL